MTRQFRQALYVILTALLLGPASVAAQEATLSGTVADSTGGVLPGVTVTAIHTASGNTFLAVTDAQGAFRIPLRVGAYRIEAELAGFGKLARTLELLVGQQAAVTLEMAPSTLQEEVTVTGEAPLLNTTTSTIGGNIDPRQMQELPVNGRGWQDLALLTPGSRSNAVTEAPVDRAAGAGMLYGLNVDGQQVTQVISGPVSGGGNPKYSRDAIAEFQLVTNRFDATQGRSLGVQVNAITKSGTNDFAGTVAGYFRDDKFNAADHVLGSVVRPYSDQQFSTTFGGPIQTGRTHFFANYEYEREPQTLTFLTPFPAFNTPQSAVHTEHLAGGRVDRQFSTKNRLSIRTNKWNRDYPIGSAGGTVGNTASSTTTAASAVSYKATMNQALGTFTTVLNDRAVNELLVGYAGFNFFFESVVHGEVPDSLVLREGASRDRGAPNVNFRGGLIIGPSTVFTPLEFHQRTISVRDNLMFSFDGHGRHDVKVGGEYLHYPTSAHFCNNCFGQLDANIAPIPANLESVFPNLLDSTTWDLGALSPITVRWRQSFGNFAMDTPRYVAAGWVQDDWVVNPKLTLNLGVRYDLQLNVFGNDVEILPYLPGDQPNDLNNLAPRFGTVYTLNDRTVLRGGYGLFFGDLQNVLSHFGHLFSSTIQVEILNDNRPDFAANPFNGPTPGYEELLTRLCTPSAPTAPGCIRRSVTSAIASPNMSIPYSHQASLGIQRQIGSTMSASADYVYTGGRKEPVTRNTNLGYNPATQSNFPFSTIATRPNPDWGAVAQQFTEGYSNAHGLETSFNKRFAHGWQVAASYTLAFISDWQTPSIVGVPLAPDIAAQYSRAVTDQRHRAVINGVWEVGRGFQASGLYFFGSGQRFATSWGPDLRDVGGVGGTNRLRPDGTVVPRNDFVGEPIHRVDVRLQQRLPLGSRVKLDGVLEIFNVLNHANFGSYTTQESNARYGLPNVNANVAYLPRTLQLGFRVAF